jgi:hypothetical protein
MIQLSALQFGMLEMFTGASYLRIEDAQQYDQRPFRSMLIRGYIAYRPGRGFHLTRLGRLAREDFHHGNIRRKNPTLPLTSYFDPTVYHLTISGKKHTSRPAQAAAA